MDSSTSIIDGITNPPDSSSLQSEGATHSKIIEYICRLDCMLLKFITTASEIRVTSIELYRAPSSTENALEVIQEQSHH